MMNIKLHFKLFLYKAAELFFDDVFINYLMFFYLIRNDVYSGLLLLITT